MNNVFDFTSYRLFLFELCNSQSQRGFQSQLAKAAGCQAAYLSQVLKQRVHLTEDQILFIANELQLSSAETRFLLLLLRYEKAGTETLKAYLKGEISDARNDQHKLSSRVPADQIVHSEKDLTVYFASWIPSAIHILTSAKSYRTVEKISQRLHLPKKEVKDILDFLVSMGWVEKKNHEYLYLGGNIHLAKDSPLQASMQAARRHLSLNSISINSKDSIHYSSLFTLDQKSYEELKKIVTAFIQKSAKVVHNGGVDELYCICVDLFEVPNV